MKFVDINVIRVDLTERELDNLNTLQCSSFDNKQFIEQRKIDFEHGTKKSDYYLINILPEDGLYELHLGYSKKTLPDNEKDKTLIFIDDFAPSFEEIRRLENMLILFNSNCKYNKIKVYSHSSDIHDFYKNYCITNGFTLQKHYKVDRNI